MYLNDWDFFEESSIVCKKNVLDARRTVLSTSVDVTVLLGRGSPRQGTLVESSEGFSSGSEARMTHLPRKSRHHAHI